MNFNLNSLVNLLCLCLVCFFCNCLEAATVINKKTGEKGQTASAGLGPHPRLFLNQAKLTSLLAQAGYNASGTKIGPGSASWNTFSSLMATVRTSGNFYNMRAWHFALMYMVTKDSAYANRAITLVRDEIQNGLGDERFDTFLYASFYIKDATIVYDWLYPLLTQPQRDEIRDYLNEIMSELWNPYLHPSYTWTGWATADRGNNYHYGHLQSTVFTAIALDGENPSPPMLRFNTTVTQPGGTATYTDIFAFLNDSFAAVDAYLNSTEVGGGWHEGDSYGGYAKYHMMECFSAMRLAGLTNYTTSMAVPRQMARYFIYSVQPGSAPGNNLNNSLTGDTPNSTFLLRALDRVSMLQLIDGLGNAEEALYLRYWLNQKFPNVASAEREQYADDFFWDQVGQPTANHAQMATSYQAPGTGWAHSRSSWLDNAVSVTFTSADRIQSHQHQDQNAFNIYYKAWQTSTANIYTHSQINVTPDFNNVIWVDNQQQRYGTGTGRLLHFESGADYTYFSGDASDAYYTNVGGYGYGTTRLLNTNIREMIHVLPNHVVVYDRVSPVQTTTPITYLLNILNAPTINGTIASATNGSGRIFQKTLLPVGATITSNSFTADSAASWQVRIKAPSNAANYTHLNLIEIADSSQAAMAASTSSSVSETSSKMNGLIIQKSPNPVVTLFSSSPTGAVVAPPISYQLSGITGAVRHVLLNLSPNTNYSISATTGASPQIAISAGGSYKSSAEGVLSFTTNNGAVALSGIPVTSTAIGTTGSGTISSSQSVLPGQTATFTVSPAIGSAATVSGCGGTLSGSTYTTAAISTACTVTATFFDARPPAPKNLRIG